MAEPYIADRATLQGWAENGDPRAAEYLQHSEATLFGIDDDDVQAWFYSQEQADRWLAGIHAEIAASKL